MRDDNEKYNDSAAPMRLDDKYTQLSGQVFLTGMQALVRLPIDQMRRDRAAGLNTATFISGYEGSPLGAYDLALNRVPDAGHVTQVDTRTHNHRPAPQEALAATRIRRRSLIRM